MRARLLITLCSLLALAIPASGGAAEHMLIGFQDDPSFRWRDDRAGKDHFGHELNRRHRPDHGALRLDELDRVGLSLDRATLGTCRNGTYVSSSIEADEALWRVVNLYLTKNHCPKNDSRRRRIPNAI